MAIRSPAPRHRQLEWCGQRLGEGTTSTSGRSSLTSSRTKSSGTFTFTVKGVSLQREHLRAVEQRGHERRRELSFSDTGVAVHDGGTGRDQLG